MATKKYQITQLKANDTLDVLHPETEAEIVSVDNSNGHYGGNGTNVQTALEEVYELASNGGVTGVKGNSETTYRTGNVNLTPANIGAEPSFTDGSATIASKAGDIVTLKAGVSQNGGSIANSSGNDIALGSAAVKNYTSSVTQNSTDLVTAGAVYTAIDNLPEPMVFKGSLGTGGTITSLPTASALNEGHTYKVITASTYSGQAAKIGDLFICAKPEGSSTYEWVYIPSADEPSGTVTSVGVSTTSNEGLVISNSPITTSGTITVNLDTAYGDKKNPYASKNANTFLAAPDGSNGTPGFRTITSSDLPDLSGTYQPKDADLTAIAGLTGTSGLLKKTAANTWALDTNNYKTENDSITVTVKSGKKANGSTDISANASGKTSITVTLGDSGVTAGTYSAVQVNAKGLVVGGAQLIEVGTTSQATPSSTLAVGGLFFKEI